MYVRRIIYVVYPAPWSGWEVVRDGSGEPTSFDDKQSAIAYAHAMAAAAGSGAIQIEDLRGRVETSWEVRCERQTDC